ncbi:hypothetical protein IGK47_004146 [Enterococcus sp. AZ007]
MITVFSIQKLKMKDQKVKKFLSENEIMEAVYFTRKDG